MRTVALASVAAEGVSHDARIPKRVLVRPGEVRGLTQFARSDIPAGCSTADHAHADMTEVFYVLAGRGRATVDGSAVDLSPGVCLRIDPGECHALEAAAEAPMSLLYFGIAPA